MLKPLITILLIAIQLKVIPVEGVLAGPISGIIVFGDSMSDTGNVFELSGGVDPPSPPYFEGRWSNGPVWVEYLADQIGVSRPGPSLLGGTNYAYAAAQTGFGVSSFLGHDIPKVGAQMDAFFQSGRVVAETDLIVMWAGFNDLYASLGGHLNPSLAAANLASHLNELIEHGGRTFLLANLTAQESTFNSLWWDHIDEIERSHPEITVHRLDFAQFVTRLFANPDSFGFANVSTPALDPTTGQVVSNPNVYATWDEPYYHLTTAVHQIVANQAFQLLVPEPTLSGDFDHDGDVDGDDLVQWRGDFGLKANSDADGDGDTDGIDFLAWQREVGTASPNPSPPISVPESSGHVAMVALASVRLHRRANRRHRPSRPAAVVANGVVESQIP